LRTTPMIIISMRPDIASENKPRSSVVFADLAEVSSVR
jgi:hypothetical protein